jgi:hypothetical protein
MVNDNCTANVDWQIMDITMNKGDTVNTYDPLYDSTISDGDNTDDIQVIDGKLYLRAERLGSNDGRIYTVTIKATDEAGNEQTTAATVKVPHHMR